ncbi:hypothetical protein SPICUR_05975 [Spiribacter curvatus]|uniref:Rrf2 family transcriptional regulator n=1 Tax=Spiribacter curvatus TaxID=1335757 RepID=U5T7I6_9GAMM|nr:Rrf2 family transcriptional regulator [Spiribacter curvatus]AGY92167.1 hypothetical protein SPICUR_05975 [Spiribacter curvatus]
MRLSTKGRYAVTTIMDLALHQGNGPVTLADISQRQDLSLSYLEQLFAQLRRHGLVHGVRGPGGGYQLAMAADRISIAAVILAVEQRVDTTACGGDENCAEGNRCITHDLWAELSDQIEAFLGGITLADLAADPALIAASG